MSHETRTLHFADAQLTCPFTAHLGIYSPIKNIKIENSSSCLVHIAVKKILISSKQQTAIFLQTDFGFILFAFDNLHDILCCNMVNR